MTLEDETGNANVILKLDFFEKNRATVLHERFVKIAGAVQSQDGVVHLRAEHIAPLTVSAAEVLSHNFR